MLRDLLLLTRAPLAASAAANLVTGVLLLRDPAAAWTREEALALALLAVASCCAYWAGMVLNDRADLERDRTLHPRRPLPSGRIAPSAATALGLGLLLALLAAAVYAGSLVGALPGQGPASMARAAVGAVLLSLCVAAYDFVFKGQRLPGSMAMAACRIVNALLGAYALGLWPGESVVSPVLLYALLIGIYVLYLTVLSFYEDEDAPPEAVATGFLGTLLPPALIALGTVAGPVRLHPAALLAAVPLALVVVWQGFTIIEDGTRARGERTTRALLRGLWLLDVAVLLGTGHWTAAGAVALTGIVVVAASMLLFAPPPAPAPPAGPS